MAARLSLVLYIVSLTAHSALTLPMMRTAPMECPLENGNLLDVHLFISDEAQCKQLCQANEVRLKYRNYNKPGSSLHSDRGLFFLVMLHSPGVCKSAGKLNLCYACSVFLTSVYH